MWVTDASQPVNAPPYGAGVPSFVSYINDFPMSSTAIPPHYDAPKTGMASAWYSFPLLPPPVSFLRKLYTSMLSIVKIHTQLVICKTPLIKYMFLSVTSICAYHYQQWRHRNTGWKRHTEVVLTLKWHRPLNQYGIVQSDIVTLYTMK